MKNLLPDLLLKTPVKIKKLHDSVTKSDKRIIIQFEKKKRRRGKNKIFNTDKEIYIEDTVSAFDKVINHSKDDILFYSLFHLTEIIASAVYFCSNEPKRNKDTYTKYHHTFFNIILYEDKQRILRITIRETLKIGEYLLYDIGESESDIAIPVKPLQGNRETATSLSKSKDKKISLMAKIYLEKDMTPENRLKEMIKQNLDGCNQILTPTICTLKNSKEGFASLGKEIYERCAASGKTVGQVILEIEKEYSANNISN